MYKIVCAGDSISTLDGYPPVLEKILKVTTMPQADVTCAGIGGNTSAQLKARVYNDVVLWNPNAVVVLVGINDIHQNVNNYTYKNNLIDIVTSIKTNLPGCKVVLVSPFLIQAAGVPIVSNTVTEVQRQNLPYFIRDARHAADVTDSQFLDANCIFQKACGVLPMTYFASESVHPTDNGKLLLSIEISKVINR